MSTNYAGFSTPEQKYCLFNLSHHPSTDLRIFFHLIFQEFALDLAQQGLEFINHKNTFKLMCLELKGLSRELKTQEDQWIDKGGR